MERPHGIQIEMDELPQGIELYEEVENVYLWCVACGLVSTFATHASPPELMRNAQEHIQISHTEGSIKL